MWHSTNTLLDDNRGQKISIAHDNEPVSYADVLDLWQEDREFRAFFTATLAGSPFKAFRLETPPVTNNTVNRGFEFVLLRADALDRQVDSTAFSEHFEQPDQADVISFRNLSGDAVLVVPRRIESDDVYGHLAAFVRNAPDSQIHDLWQLVGSVVQEQISDIPVWLSTAGMGVPWLHVRLDSHPKYYGYAPYTSY